MNICLCLIVIIIVVIIVCVICSNKKKLNIKTVFVCTTFDKYDYDFIMKWYKKLNFVVIYNGEITNYLKKLPSNIKIIKTENNGHDIGMWKYYIMNNKENIKKLDSIILMNNSMLYNKLNMNEIIKIGRMYSIYSLYLTTTENGNPPYLTSMMVMYNFDKINVNDFIKYWDELLIGGREEALAHENKQIQYYYDLGYNKFGAYSSITLGPKDYAELKTNIDLKKYPLAIKKINIIDDNEEESDKRYKEWLKL